MAGAPLDADARREEATIDQYLADNRVEEVVAELVHRLLAAKPDNPRQWLLDTLEKEICDESGELAESDLHRLFVATQRITSEVMPSETIDIVISETLHLLSCDCVSLFVLERKINMLRLYTSNMAAPITVSPGQGIAGSVFTQKEVVNISDCYQDPRFDKSFDMASGYITKSLIAVPIVDFEGSVIGVLQAINKLRPGGEVATFQKNDEKILSHLTPHVSIAMRNAEVYREAISTSERSMGLLNTIQGLSEDLGTQSLLLTITMHATKIVSSERATVFVVDEANQQLWSVSTDTGQEIRIPKSTGLAGQCCTEGIVINIPDAYADSRFNQEVDRQTGFRTQSILAIPLMDEAGARQAARSRRPAGEDDQVRQVPSSQKVVIGVIQMINKVSYGGELEVFDERDIEIMELFAKFVGPKLAGSAMISWRAPELSEMKEAELALGKVPVPGCEDRGDRARRRMSNSGLDALREEGELMISPR